MLTDKLCAYVTNGMYHMLKVHTPREYAPLKLNYSMNTHVFITSLPKHTLFCVLKTGNARWLYLHQVYAGAW